jgi:hypothetical protein
MNKIIDKITYVAIFLIGLYAATMLLYTLVTTGKVDYAMLALAFATSALITEMSKDAK